MKKIFAILLISLLLSFNASGIFVNMTKNKSNILFKGNNLYVGGSGPGNFSKIQEAIDIAEEYDTIYVFKGTYNENLFINITINLIGQNKTTTIIDSDNQHDTIYLGFPANGVTIEGFTIKNSGNHSTGGAIFDAGIEIHSDYNTIKNNIITQHPLYGIVLWASKENNITHNIMSYCGRSGLNFLAGPRNTISYNIFTENEVGVSALGSTNCKNNNISYNTFIDNRKGLAMYDTNNYMYKNNFLNNIDFNAMSHFNFLQLKPSRNQWYNNYWDDWIGIGPKWIPGFLGFNFDWKPAKNPIQYMEELL